MDISAIKYNDIKKPMQPNKSVVENLYNNTKYAGVVFDYILNLLEKRFKEQVGGNCKLKMGPLKAAERVYEKIKDDDIKTSSNVLDFLRATFSFDTIEDLLDFVNFTKSYSFTNEDFNADTLNKKVLSKIESRTKTNLIQADKNIGIVNIYEKYETALNACEGTDKELRAKIKERRSKEVEEFSKSFNFSEEEINSEAMATFTSFRNFLKNNENLPIANVGVSNSFSLGIDNEIKTKYPFLKDKLKERNSNYMDLKFYVCIPIPLSENKDYMICEVITTLNCFDKIYNKTHVLLELERSEFTPHKQDDVTEADFKEGIKLIKRAMYLDDVIEKYNNEHPNSIQIVPYKNDREYINETLNKLGDKLSFSMRICGCEKFMR